MTVHADRDRSGRRDQSKLERLQFAIDRSSSDEAITDQIVDQLMKRLGLDDQAPQKGHNSNGS